MDEQAGHSVASWGTLWRHLAHFVIRAMVARSYFRAQALSLFRRNELSYFVFSVWWVSQSRARLAMSFVPPFISALRWSTSTLILLPQMTQEFPSRFLTALFVDFSTSLAWISTPHSSALTFSFAARKYSLTLLFSLRLVCDSTVCPAKIDPHNDKITRRQVLSFTLSPHK